MGLVKLRVKITIIVLCPVNQYSCIRAGPSSQEADLQIYLLSTTVYFNTDGKCVKMAHNGPYLYSIPAKATPLFKTSYLKM